MTSDSGKTKADLYKEAMRMYRDDVAEELGLVEKIEEVGWAGLTTRDCGKVGGKMGGRIGGNMVRKMIELAEERLIEAEEEKKGAPQSAVPNGGELQGNGDC